MKCRDCEYLIVEDVNADYSRGHGRCFRWPKLPSWAKDGKRKPFSYPACRYLKERTSTLEIGKGTK